MTMNKTRFSLNVSSEWEELLQRSELIGQNGEILGHVAKLITTQEEAAQKKECIRTRNLLS